MYVILIKIAMTIQEMYENGFLMLPDFVAKYLLKSNLMTYKGKTLFAIFMKTIRFKRIVGKCPVKYISEITGIHRRDLKKSIDELITEGLIICRKSQGKYMEVEIIPEKFNDILEKIDKMSEISEKNGKSIENETCGVQPAGCSTEHAGYNPQVVVQHAGYNPQVVEKNENSDKHAGYNPHVGPAGYNPHVLDKHAGYNPHVLPPSLYNINNKKQNRAQSAPPTPPKKGGILFFSFLETLKIPKLKKRESQELMAALAQYTDQEISQAGQNMVDYFKGGYNNRLYVLSMKISTIQAYLGEFMDTEKIKNRIDNEKRAYQDRVKKDGARGGPEPVGNISQMSAEEQLKYYEGE